MKTSVFKINPTMAARLLANNENNRNVRPKHVAHLARVMANDEWRLTHQGVAIDRGGNLLDGQHRLLAVIESGIEVEMCVSTECDPSLFSAIDAGAKRNLQDFTGIPKKITETLRLGVGILAPDSSNPTPGEVEQAHRSMFGFSVDHLYGVTSNTARVFSSAPSKLCAALSWGDAWLCGNTLKMNYIDQTYKALINGDLERLSPAAMRYAKLVLKTRDSLNKTDNYLFAMRAFDYSFSENGSFRASAVLRKETFKRVKAMLAVQLLQERPNS